MKVGLIVECTQSGVVDNPLAETRLHGLNQGTDTSH